MSLESLIKETNIEEGKLWV